MKKIFILLGACLLAVAATAARPVAKQERLSERLEEKVRAAEQLPATNAAERTLQVLHETKAFIQKHLKFPADVQDKNTAGVIYGRLMPLMDSYNKLRQQDPQSARTVGAVLAREVFVSKDGTAFMLDDFITTYISSVTIPSLAQEFMQFRADISQDADAE